MKKLFAFAVAMLTSSTSCQVELSGLGLPSVDGSAGRGVGATGLDGGPVPDSNASSGVRGLADVPVGIDAAGMAAVPSTGGVSATGGVVSTASVSASGGMGSLGGALATGVTVSVGGIVSSGGMPGHGGTTASSSSGGRLSQDASAPADLAPSRPDNAISGGRDTAAAPPKLLWSDEFNGDVDTRADATKWTYLTSSAVPTNGEKQQYVNRVANAFLDGTGNLVIRALKLAGGYTSARLDTKGKFSFRTGRIEVRAKLPTGAGSAPGIVLSGVTGSWPASGGLALMEQGQDKSWFYATAYAGGASGDTGHVRYAFPNATTASSEFHVYALDWYAASLVFQVDGNNVASTTYDSTSPFATVPESIVLYLAVGGDLGGTVDSNAFPMDMLIDYVRVYSY